MNSPATWMVRAGRGGRYFDEFRDGPFVGLGWKEVGDLTPLASKDAIVSALGDAYPGRDGSMAAGQLWRFRTDMKIGDRVVTYDPSARSYLRGTITGGYTFDSGTEIEEYRNRRGVRWEGEISRDALSPRSQSSLNGLMTLFRIPDDVSAELWGEVAPVAPSTDLTDEPAASVGTTSYTYEQIELAAGESIKDRVARLDWAEMQELVAGLLRAMGYKTTVSPAGPDRGKDIIASPDGLGLVDPRIVVEVKHRKERIGSSQIRSFLGGRHPGDRGLYVSTGGFSQDAYYEADRASIPLVLMDFKALVDAILELYPKFDEETRQLLPLGRVYWPLDR